MKLKDFKFSDINLAEVDAFDLKYSTYLVKNNLVSDIEIMPEETFKFKYLRNCCGDDLFNNKESFKKFLDSNELPNNFTQMTARNSIGGMGCSNKRCKFQTCPIMLAGLILLDKTENRTLETIQEKDIETKRKEILIKRIKDTITQTSIKNEFLKYVNRLEFLAEKARNQAVPHFLILKGDNTYEKRQIATVFAEILNYYNLINSNDFCYSDSLFFGEKTEIPQKQLSYLKNLEELSASKSSDTDLYSSIIKELFRIKNKNYNTAFAIIDMTDKLYMDIIEGNNVRKKISDKTFAVDDYNIDKIVKLFYEEMRDSKVSYEAEFERNFVKYIKIFMKQNPSIKNMELIDFIVPNIVDNIIKNNTTIVSIDYLPKIQEKKNNEFDAKLNNLIGLKNVKEEVNKLACYLKYLKKVENKISPPVLSLHSLFMGNPGTGKTTVARIYTEILYNLGYIKENKLIEVSRQDLVAGYTGQTAMKTQSVIDKALGGVLFIDEAYTLTPKSSNDFGGECIATLNKAMEDNQKDLVVIFAGYKKDMEEFIQVNDGLSSRITNRIEFEDYDEQELYDIFKLEISNIGLLLSENIEEPVTKIIQEALKIENFGNGRFIKKMSQLILMKHSFNTKDTDDDDESELLYIAKKDIPTMDELMNKNSARPHKNENEFNEKLNKLIGLQTVKEDVKKLSCYLKYLKKIENKINPPELNLHSLFMGNPGTGKTTVARIYTEILYNLGYIRENKLIEVSRQDLIAGYVGQTSIKTQSVIDKALGGVLFIDEAYTLTPKYSSDFAQECIATLNKAMEDNKKDLVVIFAGYKKDMEEFIKSNDGLLSRINNKIEFKDYNKEELYNIFKFELSNIGLLLSENIDSSINKILDKAVKIDNFGNARFVKKMMQTILMKHSFNTKDSVDESALLYITENDIPTIEEILDKDSTITGKIGFNI